MLILTRFLDLKPTDFCMFSGEDIHWKSARFLWQISFENQLVFVGQISFVSSSFSGAELYWKSAWCMRQVLSRSPLKIKIVFWDRNRLKTSPFSGAKTCENQLDFWSRSPLKMSVFSGAELYWKSAHIVGQLSH